MAASHPSGSGMMLYVDVLYDQLRARLGAQQPQGLPLLIVNPAVKRQRSTKLPVRHSCTRAGAGAGAVPHPVRAPPHRLFAGCG